MALEEWKGYLLMKKYSVDNPVHDMGNAVTELYKVAGMAEIIIEAIFSGDAVTLQTVGNCMDVFLSPLRERIVRVEMLNEMMSSRVSWVQEPEDLEYYDNMQALVKLLSAEQKEKLYNLLETVSAASRKRSFIEGYKAADAQEAEAITMGNIRCFTQRQI